MRGWEVTAGILGVWLLATWVPVGAETGQAVTGPDPAGLKADLKVDQLVFCAAVKDRVPVGVADTFPADIYRVFCFTRIVDAGEARSVKHVWYRGDTLVAERILPVRSSPWRTWSAQVMREAWRGPWRVEVRTVEGALIASKKLFLE
jgi:hypothetical protein